MNLLSDKYRNERSYNGIKLDVLKSGLQKYIRRGNFEKAIWCAIELDLFALAPARGEIIRTNFIHRLMIIYLEDIGPVGLGIWERMDKLIFFLFSSRKEIPRKREKEQEAITEIVYLLSSSKHSRLLSHISAFVKIGEIKNLKILAEKYYPEIYNKYQEKAGTPKFILPLTGKEVVFRNRVNEIVYWLEKRDISVYKSVNLLLKETEGKDLPRYYRKQKPEYFVLSILERYNKKYPLLNFSKLLDIAIRWFSEIKTKEDFLVIYLLIYYFLDPELYLIKEEKEINFSELSSLYYSKNLAGEKIEIDDYVIDMHTAEGRKQGKGRTTFAEEGAYVENEWEGSNILNLKSFYEEGKKIQEKGFENYVPKALENVIIQREEDRIILPEKESEAFDFRIRAQLTCSHSRPDTYFAYDKSTGEPIFVKGPYETSEQVDNVIEISKIKNSIGLSFLPYRVLYLYPDMFISVPIGIRNKLNKKKKYPFLICPDVCMGEEYPIIKKSSKMWPLTEVVDWENVKECLFPDIYLKENKEIFLKWILNFLFRYLMGIPDCAKRNFLYLPLYSEIIAIDEDTKGKEVNPFIKLKANDRKIIKKFIFENLQDIKKNYKEWKKKINLKNKNLKGFLQLI